MRSILSFLVVYLSIYRSIYLSWWRQSRVLASFNRFPCGAQNAIATAASVAASPGRPACGSGAGSRRKPGTTNRHRALGPCRCRRLRWPRRGGAARARRALPARTRPAVAVGVSWLRRAPAYCPRLHEHLHALRRCRVVRTDGVGGRRRLAIPARRRHHALLGGDIC